MDQAHHCPAGSGLIPYYAVFIDFDTVSVLVKHENSVTTFPLIQSGEIPHRGQHMCECFSAQLEKLIGIKYDLVFLNSTINQTYQRHLPSIHFALFECVGPNYDPVGRALTGDLKPPPCPEYRWVSVHQLFEDDDPIVEGLDDPGYYAWQVAQTSFAGEIKENGVRPWETSSWLCKTKRKTETVLRDLGYTVTGNYEQHQISPTAAVLRIPTNRGRLYLKASHKREGRTMKSAAKFAPFLVPSPLYVDEDDELTIMQDYCPTLLDTFTKEDYNAILKLHGKLQLASMAYVEELMEIGLPRMSFKFLKERAEKLLEDPDVDESLRRISGMADMAPYRNAVYDLIRKLYVDLDLPLTIVHGDMHDDNMIKTERKGMEYAVYDWGSAHIDIPFRDIINLEYEVREEDRSDITMEPYLKLWARYGNVEDLKRVCSALCVKENIVRFIDLYDYSKGMQFSPVLLDDDVTRLWAVLSSIPDTSLL